MQKTPLYENHLRLGAKIVDFSGWAMPVQYTNVIEEHQATRRQAGLFDICHMGEFEIRGPQALALLQRVMSRDLSKQTLGQIKLSVMTNEKGGILDDVTVYRLQETSYMVVTNAGTREKDLDWIRRQKEAGGFSAVEITDISDRTGKLDLQGPRSGISSRSWFPPIFQPCRIILQSRRSPPACPPSFPGAVTPAKTDSKFTPMPIGSPRSGTV